ncbi:MAG: peptidylprolyl isomerase [Planctomycetaceae bacterium]|nr:peptidylprolyl isomerase [Planctomycetaceae bacterium]
MTFCTMRSVIYLPLVLLAASSVFTSGQEPAAPAAPTDSAFVKTEAEAAALGPKNQAYMQTFNEFRELGKKLTAMKVENQNAAQSRQNEIQSEYPKLYKQGLEVHKKLLHLGLDAHDEAPNRNPFVSNLVYSTIWYEFSRENYEETVRIFKRLSVKGIDEKGAGVLRAYAGLAAMLTMNYADAEAWLKTAKERGDLESAWKEMSGTAKGKEQVESLRRFLTMMPQAKEAWTKEEAIRKAETEAGEKDAAKKLPRVELTTSKGKIVLELFENEAPNTVANFISLVEKGFYNGVVFHRVLPVFMAQGGDPTGTGRGGPGYSFDDECGAKFPNFRQHFRGSISMANAGPNTNGSQFFLTFVPTSFLDGRHTVFGRIAEGMEVLADLQRVDPSDEKSVIPELDKIVEAKVLNKRNHPYEVKKSGNR